MLMRHAGGLRQRAHHRSMHQHDSGIALEHCIVALSEAARRIASREQLARLDQQNLCFGSDLIRRHGWPRRRRTPTVAGIADQFVNADDQLGNRMQPRERGIADEELQHLTGTHGAVTFFVRGALALDQSLVKIQKGSADLCEAFVRGHGVV